MLFTVGDSSRGCPLSFRKIKKGQIGLLKLIN